MSGFSGFSTQALDGKNRVMVPAKHRRTLPNDLYLVKSLDKHYPTLRLFTPEGYDQWIEDIFEDMGGRKRNSMKQQNLLRKLQAASEDIKLDQTGRLLIPKYLKDYAGLGKNIVFVGMVDFIEIWDSAAFERFQADMDDLDFMDDDLDDPRDVDGDAID